METPVGLLSFKDSDNTAEPNDFFVSIDWGDGTSSTGSVSVNYNKRDVPVDYVVRSAHTYANSDSYPISVTVQSCGATLSASTTSQFRFTAPFGNSFSGLVARLHPVGGPGDPTQETAAISWGDGSVTEGQLSVPSGDSTALDVSGDHIYWVPGDQAASVTITDPSGSQIYAGTATVQSTYSGLGDSYSSGEGAGWPGNAPNLPGCDWHLYKDPSGNPARTDHIDKAFRGPTGCTYPPLSPVGNTCHRAVTAYAHVVERLLAVADMTLHFVACSGDVVEDVYRGTNPDGYNPVHDDHLHVGEGPQAGALSSNTSLITLTFGGNNSRFADVAKACVVATLTGGDAECLKQDRRILGIMGYATAAGSSNDGTFLPLSPNHQSGVPHTGFWTQTESTTNSTLNDLYKFTAGTAGTETTDGNDLHDALVLLYRKLKDLAPGARILVLGYPHFFPAGGAGSECEHFSNLEQQWVNDRIALADHVIEDAVNESGVAQYVDVYQALTGHEECQGDHQYTVDSAGEVSNCAGAFINGIYIAGGVQGTPENLHPNPCEHLVEGEIAAAAYSTQDGAFSLGPGQSQSFQYTVGPGESRLNVSATWSTQGALSFTLTGPNGETPSLVQTGSVYITWDVPFPAPGTWTLSVLNNDASGTGLVRGSVVESAGSIPQLPPEGQVQMIRSQCDPLGHNCLGTFKASVNHALDSSVSSYTWYDDKGSRQGKGDTMTMSSVIGHFKIILRTDGLGEFRYAVWECDASTMACKEVSAK